MWLNVIEQDKFGVILDQMGQYDRLEKCSLFIFDLDKMGLNWTESDKMRQNGLVGNNSVEWDRHGYTKWVKYPKKIAPKKWVYSKFL